MPTVDFTLDEVKQLFAAERQYTESLFVAERENTKLLFSAEREHTESMFMAERQHTKAMIHESAENVKQTIASEFLSFWDVNLGPAFDSLHTEFAELRREGKGLRSLVDRHSKDIMELRATQ